MFCEYDLSVIGLQFLMQPFPTKGLLSWKGLIICLILVDTEDLKNFSKSQGAVEADDLSHWDLNFWSERLRESKYDINEVKSLFFSKCIC